MSTPPPAPPLILFQQKYPLTQTLLSLVTILTLGYIGLSETMGKHLQYSKFWNSKPIQPLSKKKGGVKLGSRVGMLVLYTPAFLAGLGSFFVCPDGGGLRFWMVKLAVTVHFLKRDLEVLFVHKYSGGMILDTAILISAIYFFAAAGMIYVQHLTIGFPEPSIDLKYVGLVLLLVGLYGNFYHHNILSKLRKKDDQGYKIPKGGLFDLVICPHYLFEIIVFMGIACISQTLFSLSCAIASGLYLAGRSYSTREWYLSKFENFPKDVKALIPYIF